MRSRAMHIIRVGGGYQLRTGARGPGQTKFFADSKHGGSHGAHEAAKAAAAATGAKRRENERALVRNVRICEGPNGILLKLARGTKRTTVSLDKHGIGPGIAHAVSWVGLKGDAAEAAALALLVRCER